MNYLCVFHSFLVWSSNPRNSHGQKLQIACKELMNESLEHVVIFNVGYKGDARRRGYSDNSAVEENMGTEVNSINMKIHQKSNKKYYALHKMKKGYEVKSKHAKIACKSKEADEEIFDDGRSMNKILNVFPLQPERIRVSLLKYCFTNN